MAPAITRNAETAMAVAEEVVEEVTVGEPEVEVEEVLVAFPVVVADAFVVDPPPVLEEVNVAPAPVVAAPAGSGMYEEVFPTVCPENMYTQIAAFAFDEDPVILEEMTTE